MRDKGETSIKVRGGKGREVEGREGKKEEREKSVNQEMYTPR